MPKVRTLLPLALLASASLAAAATNEVGQSAPPTTEEWPYLLPIYGKDATARGLENLALESAAVELAQIERPSASRLGKLVEVGEPTVRNE